MNRILSLGVRNLRWPESRMPCLIRVTSQPPALVVSAGTNRLCPSSGLVLSALSKNRWGRKKTIWMASGEARGWPSEAAERLHVGQVGLVPSPDHRHCLHL